MSLFERLTPEQINGKMAFINRYANAENSADGSLVDANSNVDTKNIGILESEMYKPETIQINRAIIQNKLKSLFPDEGEELAKQYVQDIESHLIYVNDETSIKPYCASITLFPFLLNGTKPLGGTSKAPKNLRSFTGSFVNLVYQVAAQFSGAIATVEWPMYFDYFARKTYGDNYLETNKRDVEQELQGVVYSLNQPAAARGNQSVFWNTSMLDKYYFEHLFGEFVFPDGSKPNYESVRRFQDFFMDWFRREREKELLTYPVLTASLLVNKDGYPVDDAFARNIAKHMSKGLSFFVYESNTVDSLSSCCRLRNELADNTFSYTLGAGGVSTGSTRVITINMNRMVQYLYPLDGDSELQPFLSRVQDHLEILTKRVHKYLLAHRSVIKEYIDKGLLPAYSEGFISIDKQFLTVGINGMLEASEFLVHGPSQHIYSELLSVIYHANKEDKKLYGCKFNTECIPAENLGVKNAAWDKKDGYVVKRSCYNSYFYPVEDESYNIIDRLMLHGKETTKYLDGGSACHLNISQLLTEDQAYHLIVMAGKIGVNYWTFNCLVTVCNDCGYINVNTEDHCIKCGSKDVDYATRVIGYLRLISSFSKARQVEAGLRYYDKVK